MKKSILQKLANQGLSQRKIAKILNCSQSHISRLMRRYKIKTRFDGTLTMKKCLNCCKQYRSHNTKAKYCSHKCQKTFQYKQYIKDWLDGNISAVTKGNGSISTNVRRWLKEQRGEKCWKCSWKKKHPITNNIPVEIDHIDGNYQNDRPENLRLLCPNCHSLTPNFRALNKGKGRKSR